MIADRSIGIVPCHWEAVIYRGQEPIEEVPLEEPETDRMPDYVHFAEPVEIRVGDTIVLREAVLGVVAWVRFGTRTRVSWIGTRFGESGLAAKYL